MLFKTCRSATRRGLDREASEEEERVHVEKVSIRE